MRRPLQRTFEGIRGANGAFNAVSVYSGHLKPNRGFAPGTKHGNLYAAISELHAATIEQVGWLDSYPARLKYCKRCPASDYVFYKHQDNCPKCGTELVAPSFQQKVSHELMKAIVLNEYVGRSNWLGADAAANGNISTQHELISPSGWPSAPTVAAHMYDLQHDGRWPRVTDGDRSAAWNVEEGSLARKAAEAHEARRAAQAAGRPRGAETRALAGCKYCDGQRYCEPGMDCCCSTCKAYGMPYEGRRQHFRKHTGECQRAYRQHIAMIARRRKGFRSQPATARDVTEGEAGEVPTRGAPGTATFRSDSLPLSRFPFGVDADRRRQEETSHFADLAAHFVTRSAAASSVQGNALAGPSAARLYDDEASSVVAASTVESVAPPEAMQGSRPAVVPVWPAAGEPEAASDAHSAVAPVRSAASESNAASDPAEDGRSERIAGAMATGAMTLRHPGEEALQALLGNRPGRQQDNARYKSLPARNVRPTVYHGNTYDDSEVWNQRGRWKGTPLIHGRADWSQLCPKYTGGEGTQATVLPAAASAEPVENVVNMTEEAWRIFGGVDTQSQSPKPDTQTQPTPPGTGDLGE